MRFTLVWNGLLPSTGNNKKPAEVARIRDDLHPQMKTLWDTHNALQVLKEQGYKRNPDVKKNILPGMLTTPKQLAEKYPDLMINMCDELPVGGKRFMPLVRESLNLTCDLKILFLRQEDPGSLQHQGGDLDGRLKFLLDALRMPSAEEENRAPSANELNYCLMEGDSLVSSLAIETERLLFPKDDHPHEVFLIIEVSLRILQVHPWNYCLL